MQIHNKKIILAKHPTGMVQENDFEIQNNLINNNCADGEIIVENKYISLDPAMRGWMNKGTTYIKGLEPGDTMRAFTAGEIIATQNEKFKVGDWVQGLDAVQNFSVTTGNTFQKIENKNFPLNWHLGLLGMPGLTAYFGLLDKGKPKQGDVVVISGAAGMVGSLVGQIAKIKGCIVVGIAGGKEKCNFLKNELNFDEAIDYKTENIATVLKEKYQKGIDVYFDNVGGQILDDVMLNLAIGARVVICGAISQYNDASFNGLKNYMKIVSARATLSGIIVFDYFPQAANAIQEISQWHTDGKIKYKEHIIDGMENFAATLQMLFKGENTGKLLIKI